MKVYSYLGLLLISAGACAAGNQNPASIAYVNTAIQSAAYTAGPGIVINNTVRTISQTPNYSIGDVVQGAVVFWLDDTNQHGLAVSLEDQSTGAAICTSDTVAPTYTCPIPFVRSKGLGGGAMNTAALLGAQIAAFATQSPYTLPQFAASLANEYDGALGGNLFSGGFYLPTFDEATILYRSLATVNPALASAGGKEISGNDYWTSFSDLNIRGNVYKIDMSNGDLGSVAQNETHYVRAIRQF
ncbi:MAG: hypothetical protein P1U36_06790 [Legionellaceae bacterium]|nr:hypothetical protein [Legionellaceae bacterium]